MKWAVAPPPLTVSAPPRCYDRLRFTPPPCSAALAGADALERASASYEPRYQRFVVKTRQYTQQYSHIYTRRLTVLRPIVLEAARKKYGDGSE